MEAERQRRLLAFEHSLGVRSPAANGPAALAAPCSCASMATSSAGVPDWATQSSGAVPSYVGGASHVNGEHSIAARLARGDFAFLTSNLRVERKDRQSRAQNPRRPR